MFRWIYNVKNGFFFEVLIHDDASTDETADSLCEPDPCRSASC